MATLEIAKTHVLSHEDAKRAAEKIAKDLNKRFDLEYSWKGDVIEFERPGLTGKLHVGMRAVRLDCQLGFMLSLLKPKIEDVVHRDFDRYFGTPKAAAGPKPKAGR